VEFNRFLEEYGNAPDLNPPPPPKRTRRDAEFFGGRDGGGSFQRGGRPSGGMVRLRVNLGRRQSVLPPQLIGLVNQATHTRNIRLGRIDINTDWSDIQVEASMADKVEQSLRGFDFRGMKIRVERGSDSREPRGRTGGGGGESYPSRGRRSQAKNRQWKKRKG